MNQTSDKHKMYTGKKWIIPGLIWGTIMFVIMTFAFPYLTEQDITLKNILIGIVVWTLSGLAYGYTMKLVLIRMANKKH